MDDAAPLDLARALSPEWLSAALGGRVTDVRVVETLKTMATKVRFEVGLDGQKRGYCIKGFFGDGTLSAGEAVNGQAEARYYLEFAPDSAVNAPNCRYAGIDADTGHGVILMDDIVVAGGAFLTALQPYSIDQAAATLGQLARLHAEHWNGRGLDRRPWLRNRAADMAEQSLIPLDMLQGLMDGERSKPLSPAITSAARMHAAIRALAEVDRDQPACLVHGDAHAGNIYVLNGEPGLIDWQVLQRSHWALDVAYHIGAALSTEVREVSEQDLIRDYLDRLRGHGVEAPAWNDAWLAYRRHLAYGYYMWGVTRRVDPPIILEFVKRLGLAVASLECFEALGV
jgi:aminoglycoside/choline kinase family phosphotransferase